MGSAEAHTTGRVRWLSLYSVYQYFLYILRIHLSGIPSAGTLSTPGMECLIQGPFDACMHARYRLVRIYLVPGWYIYNYDIYR